MMRKKILLTSILYLLVAIISTGSAVIFASLFMQPSHAQNPPNDPNFVSQEQINHDLEEAQKKGGMTILPVNPDTLEPSPPPQKPTEAPKPAEEVKQAAPPPAPPTQEVKPPEASALEQAKPTDKAAAQPVEQQPNTNPVSNEASAAPPPPAPPVVPSPSQTTTSPDGFLQTFQYVVGDRRDPFQPQLYAGARNQLSGPTLPLQLYDLGQLKVTAIMWDVSRPMAMIRDPKGVVHIVNPNDKIGKNNGYVAVIRDGELVVVEPIQNEGRIVFTTKLMRLTR